MARELLANSLCSIITPEQELYVNRRAAVCELACAIAKDVFPPDLARTLPERMRATGQFALLSRPNATKKASIQTASALLRALVTTQQLG